MYVQNYAAARCCMEFTISTHYSYYSFTKKEIYEKGNFSMIDYEYARYELRTKVASRPKTVYTGVRDGNMARSVFPLFFYFSSVF